MKVLHTLPELLIRDTHQRQLRRKATLRGYDLSQTHSRPVSKLSEDDVREIRTTFGRHSVKNLMQKFNISKTCVESIRNYIIRRNIK